MPREPPQRRPLAVASLAFWLAALVFAVLMLGTTLPTPLYPLYEARFGFGSGVVTLVFATYAVGVLAALLFLGRASDRSGRRPVLALALALAAVSTVIFLLAQDLAMLFVARLLSGLAAGLATGTGTAAIADLTPADRARRGALVATAANIGGLSLGPLLAGFLAEYAPHPIRLSYAVYLLLAATAALALAVMPETVPPRGRPRPARPRLGLPDDGRPQFAAACLAGFASFTVMGLYSALAPSFLAGSLHERNHALAGGAVFLMFAAATVAQVALHRLSSTRAAAVGAVVVLAGLALLEAALDTASLALFVPATLCAGSGAGLLFMGSLADAGRLAPPDRRAEVVSTFFLASYVGLTLPVIGVGVAAERVGQLEATLVCSAAVAAVALASVAGMRRAAGRA